MDVAVELLRHVLRKAEELSESVQRHLTGLLLGVHLHIIMDGNANVASTNTAFEKLCSEGRGYEQLTLELLRKCGLFEHLISLGNAHGAVTDILDLVQSQGQLQPSCLELLLKGGHALLIQQHPIFPRLSRSQQVRLLLCNLFIDAANVLPKLFQARCSSPPARQTPCVMGCLDGRCCHCWTRRT